MPTLKPTTFALWPSLHRLQLLWATAGDKQRERTTRDGRLRRRTELQTTTTTDRSVMKFNEVTEGLSWRKRPIKANHHIQSVMNQIRFESFSTEALFVVFSYVLINVPLKKKKSKSLTSA